MMTGSMSRWRPRPPATPATCLSRVLRRRRARSRISSPLTRGPASGAGGAWVPVEPWPDGPGCSWPVGPGGRVWVGGGAGTAGNAGEVICKGGPGRAGQVTHLLAADRGAGVGGRGSRGGGRAVAGRAGLLVAGRAGREVLCHASTLRPDAFRHHRERP